MQSASRRSKRVCGCLVFALLLGAAPAQPALSSLDVATAIELRSQSLGEALRTLAKQANLQILFDAGLVAGRSAPAVRGNLTPRAALHELLGGTDLEAWEQAPGVVVIRRRETDPTVMNGPDEVPGRTSE